MNKLIKKLKHWYWLNFKATEKQKCIYDTNVYGKSFMVGRKRIDPRKFYK